MQLTDDGELLLGGATSGSGYLLNVNGTVNSTNLFCTNYFYAENIHMNGYLKFAYENVIQVNNIYDRLRWQMLSASGVSSSKVHIWELTPYTSNQSQVLFKSAGDINQALVRAYSVASTSDDRLKTNETLLTNATETLMKLKPQLYDHYTNETMKTEPIKSVGLIAQEIYYAAPELRDYVVHLPVDGSGNMCSPTEVDLSNQDPANDPDYEAIGWTKDEYASVDYVKLIPYLIKSNQEQQEKINALESRLSALENN